MVNLGKKKVSFVKIAVLLLFFSILYYKLAYSINDFVYFEFVLDNSSSMNNTIDKQTKLELVLDSLTESLKNIPEYSYFFTSLRVFNITDNISNENSTFQLYKMQPFQYDKFISCLNSIKAIGASPVYYNIKLAIEQLKKYVIAKKVVVLFVDGRDSENFNLDKKIFESDIDFYIIGINFDTHKLYKIPDLINVKRYDYVKTKEELINILNNILSKYVNTQKAKMLKGGNDFSYAPVISDRIKFYLENEALFYKISNLNQRAPLKIIISFKRVMASESGNKLIVGFYDKDGNELNRDYIDIKGDDFNFKDREFIFKKPTNTVFIVLRQVSGKDKDIVFYIRFRQNYNRKLIDKVSIDNKHVFKNTLKQKPFKDFYDKILPYWSNLLSKAPLLPYYSYEDKIQLNDFKIVKFFLKGNTNILFKVFVKRPVQLKEDVNFNIDFYNEDGIKVKSDSILVLSTDKGIFSKSYNFYYPYNDFLYFVVSVKPYNDSIEANDRSINSKFVYYKFYIKEDNLIGFFKSLIYVENGPYYILFLFFVFVIVIWFISRLIFKG